MPSSSWCLAGRALSTEVLTTAARSAGVRGRPSSAANRSRTGSAPDLLGAFDHRVISSAGTPANSGLPVRVDRVEDHPEPLGQLAAQRRLVERAGGFLVVVDLVPVDGPPATVGAAQLVHHQRVGMQLRITRPRRAVIEDGRGETRRGNLLDPIDAFPGHRRVGVQEIQRLAAAPRLRCASAISVPTVAPPIAHNPDTDFGAEKHKSKPVTPSVRHARPRRRPVSGCSPRASSASSSCSSTTASRVSESSVRPRPHHRPGASPRARKYSDGSVATSRW